jgi:aryl-alcohol dehydrogenase-like predicted oxidoreductase
MIDRRKLLTLTLGAAAALAIHPVLVGAAQSSGGKLIQRPIPSTGEMLPAIGLAFSNHPGCSDHAALKEVVKTFADSGGKYIDMTLGNAANQQFHMDAASELGVANKLFWSSTAFIPGPNPAPDGGVKTQIDSVLARTKAAKVDLAWITAAGPPGVLAALKEEKKAGRVRYIGVMTISVKSQAAQLETLMRNEPIDFIGVDYDVSNRFVEDKILPLAQERKIGVVAFLPFNNASGLSCTGGTSLFTRVANKPLPDWAAEFDAKSWAQFFLKYVLSHPAVTVVRTGTTKATHMVDNLGGGIGRLPSEARRKQMAALVDALPPAPPPAGPPPPAPGIALPVSVIERYVGEYKAATGFTVIIRRDGDKLFVKPGNNPEAPLLARSETRFQDPRGPYFEFQLDAQGKVTGAILEQQGPQGPTKTQLERK